MPRIFYAAIALLALTGPAVAEITLPDIGGSESALVTQVQEDRFGEELLREFRRTLPLLDDPLVESYIQSIGHRLAASAPDARGSFHFLVIRDPRVNAFAAPGGIIGVNTGLLTAARSESELAAVLAHEIAHVTQRHLARMYAASTQIDFATGLAVLAGLIASAYDPNIAQATMITAMAAGEQSRINHTRANEQEADRIGLRVLTSAGFDPRAMPDFFERMMELGRHNPDALPEYLRTHPVSTARLSDTRGRAEQYGTPQPRDDRSFRLAQTRAHALTVSPTTAIEDLRAGRIAPADEDARLYGEAVARLRNGQFEEASTILGALNGRHRGNLFIGIAQAEALTRTGEPQPALDRLARLDEIHPGYPPVAQATAKILIETRRPAEALRTLDRSLSGNPEQPQLLKLKSEAARDAGRPALAHEAMADYYRLHGQYAREIEQIELALRQPGLDEFTALRLRGKQSEARQRMQERQR